jgi:hypothetical protein
MLSKVFVFTQFRNFRLRCETLDGNLFDAISLGRACLEFDRKGSYEHEVFLQLSSLATTCSDLQTFQNFLD